ASCVLRRYLQSFPTRRSSDLVWRLENIRMAGRQILRFSQRRREGGQRFLADKFDAQIPINVQEFVALILVVEDLDALARELAERDRKSTRLNSSHGSISYAVF